MASGSVNLTWARQEECWAGIAQGLHHFCNFELRTAEQVYQPFITDSPLASFLYAEVAFMKAILSEEKAVIDDAKRKLEAAVKLGETVLNRIGKVPPSQMPSEPALKTSSVIYSTRMAQGEAALWLGSLRLKNQDNVKGVYWLRRAYK